MILFYVIIVVQRWVWRSDVTATRRYFVTGPELRKIEFLDLDEDKDMFFDEEVSIWVMALWVRFIDAIVWVAVDAKLYKWVVSHGFVFIWWRWYYDYIIFIILDD